MEKVFFSKKLQKYLLTLQKFTEVVGVRFRKLHKQSLEATKS